MLKEIHFLLTYMCNSECDHCFVYSSPSAQGTFTLSQVGTVIEEACKIGTVETVMFEGGEAFLFYPLMVEGIRSARNMGLETGVVTNSYFATTVEDAELWLRPLCELGISKLHVSDDEFHFEEKDDSPAKRVLAAAKNLGMQSTSISIDEPVAVLSPEKNQGKGAPVVGGGAMFRGRAVEKLAPGLPTTKWEELTECPYEELERPKRVHVDSYGNVHLCQGLSMGNMWDTPLSQLVAEHNVGSHPICAPLVSGGPAALVKKYDIKHSDGYVDSCHLCYVARKRLLDTFPQYLAPRQVYGVE